MLMTASPVAMTPYYLYTNFETSTTGNAEAS